MSDLGTFYGVGVGPGNTGFLPVAAVEALRQSDVIFVPRARHATQSVAGQCLSGLNIPQERLRDIAYNMESDRSLLGESYAALAREIAQELLSRKTVAYVTIGDSLTYSTYSYTLRALLDILPDVPRRTFPGITSYAAAASALEWPIGQGKERTLILPCPDKMTDLKADIESHDIVILMKIGHRLPAVLDLLNSMSIAPYCALTNRLGLPGEIISRNIQELPLSDELGYLTTMLIRKTPSQARAPVDVNLKAGVGDTRDRQGRKLARANQ